MRLSIREAASIASVTLIALLAPARAAAEGRWCEWAQDRLVGERGVLVCRADTACATGSCSRLGESDLVCLDGECVPPCSTIRLCDTTADCPAGAMCTLLDGPRPTIAGGGYAPAGACAASDTAPSRGVFPPASLPCAHTWEGWEALYRYDQEFPGFGRRPVHTPTWTHGDSDGDGCVNQLDDVMCVSGTGPCLAVEPSPPPTCPAPTLPTERCCTVVGGALRCDGADCSCSTIRACNPEPRAYGDSECPALLSDGNPGACLRPGAPGTLGVCFFEEFLEDCGDLEALDFASCFRTGRGTFTTNFFEGDCDADGCPNGQDVDRCEPCDGAACADESVDMCAEVSNAGLADPIRCVPADASTPPLPDGAIAPLDGDITPLDDAGPALDAARPPLDAAVLDGSPAPSPRFGASGVQCAIGARGDPRAAHALYAIGLTFIALVFHRRR